jgi:hypothetical protein
MKENPSKVDVTERLSRKMATHSLIDQQISQKTQRPNIEGSACKLKRVKFSTLH